MKFTINLQKSKASGAEKIIGKMLVAIIISIFVSIGSNAYTVDGENCTCENCTDCTNALNDSDCRVVELSRDIINHNGTCIDNPDNFNDKVFDCQVYGIGGNHSGYYDYGIYLNGKSGNIIRNCIVTDFDHGIHLYNSSSNSIINNAINNGKGGISLLFSSSNSIINNTVKSNTCDGISLSYSSNNTIINNTIKDNSELDISLYAYSEIYRNEMYCNNVIENNTGTGDKPIKFFNHSVNLQNEVLSELILCNADNSNINNVTVGGIGNNGISVLFTDDSKFTNVNSSNNHHGISLNHFSSNNILINNTVNSNEVGGISLDSSSNNNLTDNTANNNHLGIYLEYSSNNIMRNNTMNNNTYNFNIDGREVSDYYEDIDTSNTVNGKPIYYWTNEKNAPDNCRNAEISDLNAGFVALISCDNITVKNLNLSNNSHGILLVNTTNSNILNSTLSSNMNDGIYLYFSSNNNITRNNASSNWEGGIDLSYSSKNSITNNTANSNWVGIHLDDSPDNTLSDNTIKSNNGGVYLSGHSNFNKILNNKILNNNQTGIRMSLCCYIFSTPPPPKISECEIGAKICGCMIGAIYNSGNEILNNEILNNNIGIYSKYLSSIITSNIVCNNTHLDFNSPDWQLNSGDNNTCDNPDNWNDTEKSGCTYNCSYIKTKSPTENLSATENETLDIPTETPPKNKIFKSLIIAAVSIILIIFLLFLLLRKLK